jgi:sugar phosphate isomerase/epimerase
MSGSRARRAIAALGLAGLGLAVLGGIAGCGPIRYAAAVDRATEAVAAARAARAERYAPYWWTRALEYLHEAKRLAGRADYQAADRFGRLAGEAANLAEQEAVVAAKDPARHPPGPPAAATPPPGRVAPAKDPP